MAKVAELPPFTSPVSHLSLADAAALDEAPATPSTSDVFYYNDFQSVIASDAYVESAKNFLASGIQDMVLVISFFIGEVRARASEPTHIHRMHLWPTPTRIALCASKKSLVARFGPAVKRKHTSISR